MKRTIEEIVTIYELEPSTNRDVFVEGVSDRELIVWYMSELGQSGRAVYPIDLVDVPSGLLQELGLPHGSNRSRVIALAIRVWQEISQEQCGLIFIVDRDLADFIDGQIPPRGIVMTDGASMDGYLLSDSSVDKYLSLVCRVAPLYVCGVRESIYRILAYTFALRIALQRLNMAVRIVSLSKLISIDGVAVSINEVELVRRTLLAGNQVARLNEVFDEIKDIRAIVDAKAGGDFANGHDAFLVLGECANSMARDSAYREERRVRMALMMALKRSDLDERELFKLVM
ncbi:hypothetical protein [Lysobacter firmicutimachus]|uniref:DUF4435 domain-containing protein n=1 Tax=Lysobacter firmicutimachus TaxID=1792846 RepID=A0ABU8D302_9GAMM